VLAVVGLDVVVEVVGVVTAVVVGVVTVVFLDSRCNRGL
jgi:hypothetical protein